jgi:hypothetical protein
LPTLCAASRSRARAIEAGSARRSLDYARLIRLADALGTELGALMRRADSLDAGEQRHSAWRRAG